MSLRSRFLERVDLSARRSIASALAEGETVEIVVSGLFGTLSGGNYESAGFSLASLVDPFDVFLTSSRLLAVRTSRGRRHDPTVTLVCDRSSAHVDGLRRNPAFDRVTFVFKDETLGLTSMRRNRARLDRLVDEL